MNTMDEKTTGIEWMEPASPEALLPDSGLWPWLAAAVIAVLVVSVVMIVLRKKKPAATSLRVLRNAAFAEAIAALAKTTTTDVRDAAVQSSLILRNYLSTAAGDPALFETHEEFVARHDALSALTTAARSAADAGFGRLAALKYAPGIPAATPAEVIAESRTLLETLHHGFAA